MINERIRNCGVYADRAVAAVMAALGRNREEAVVELKKLLAGREPDAAYGSVMALLFKRTEFFHGF